MNNPKTTNKTASLKEGMESLLNTSKIVKPPIQKIQEASINEDATAFNVWLDKDLKKRLKKYSIDIDTSMKEIVQIAVKDYLDRKEGLI